MTQFQINKAYGALMQLSGMKLPVKKAYEIYSLVKAVDSQYQFAISEEQKIVEKYKGTVNSDGSISFESAESYGSFQEDILELHNLEADVEIKPVVLMESDMKDQTISPADIFSLEGFVSFE